MTSRPTRVLVHLPCAFRPPWMRKGDLTSESKRESEFAKGFDTFFEVLETALGQLEKMNYNLSFRVQVFDNTLLSKEDLYPEVLKRLSGMDLVLAPGANVWGHKNKGAGNIEGLMWCEDRVQNSDWVVHHEPRVEIQNPQFLLDCLLKGPTRFADRGDHFYTGTFCMRSWDLMKFCHMTDLEDMVTRGVGIEYNLCEFVKKTIPPKNLVLYPDAGVLWHDTATGGTQRM